MVNIQNQDLDTYMNEIFSILESDNKLNFIAVTPSIKNMIFTLYNHILKEILITKTNKIIATIFRYNFRKELYRINISILKTELSCFSYLFVNSEYLDDYEKEILVHYFNILKYALEIDFLRNEWLSQNSNKGRTILTKFQISNIEKLYDAILSEFIQLNELKNNSKVKELRLNEQ